MTARRVPKLICTADIEPEYIEVPFQKGCICVLTRDEIVYGLPKDVLLRGLRRGKGVRRGRAMAERDARRQVEELERLQAAAEPTPRGMGCESLGATR